MRKRLPAILLAALLAVFWLPAPPAAARVFLRWGTAGRAVRALEQAGARVLYEADIELNGGQGHLTVVAFENGLTRSVATMRRSLPGIQLRHDGGSLALGELADGGTVVRCVALQVGDIARTVVMLCDQSRADYEASRTPPATHALRELPAFPASLPLFYARNAETALGVAVARSSASATEVFRFYHEALTRNGWQPQPGQPDLASPAEGGLRFYQNRGRIAIVHAMPTADGQTRITVLHKELGAGK